MTTHPDLIGTPRGPTRGCRFCKGWGVGPYHAACVHCPTEAKRIADEEEEQRQAWAAKRYTVQEALSIAERAALWGPALTGQAMTPDAFFTWLVEQGKVIMPEPLYTVHVGNEEEMAVLKTVMGREAIEEAHALAGGEPGRIVAIIKERLAAELERRRVARAQDVTPEEASQE